MTPDQGAPVLVHGSTAPGWEPVRAAFQANFDRGMETGAAVAIYHEGRPVVDLWGGVRDRESGDPYAEDTLQLVFSSTKGIAAIAVAQCVERGWLDYGAPVADCWPEFAAAGKEQVTVAQLLAHQAGLAALDGPASLEEMLDWDRMVARLAALAPLWEPGTAHGYHAVTFGWLAGELVRRVDPKGRSLGGFVADEIVTPLGTELWIGLPEQEEPRVAPLVPAPPPDNPAVAEMMGRLVGPETLAGKALTLNGAFCLTGPMVWNTRAVHAAEIPAANAITNARSLARTYAATVGEVDGVRLLDDPTAALASATATPPNEPDQVLVIPTAFGMGFMTSGMFVPMLGEGSFGHPGAGGSLGFAYPDAGIGFGYVMNQMGSTLSGDVRALTLIEAVKESLAG